MNDTQTTERVDDSGMDSSGDYGPDCPLYGQFHDSEPDAATKATVRAGAMWALIGGLIAFLGGVGGKIFWLGQFASELGAAGGDTGAAGAVAERMYGLWVPYVVVPMAIGGILGMIGIWLLTVPGSAPDRGRVSARAASRVLLLAVPYAIIATFIYLESGQLNKAGEWFYFNGVVLSVALLVLLMARHLDNVLAAVGSGGRVVAQAFYLSVLVAAALGLQQDPAQTKFSGWFAAGIGLAAFFGVLTLLRVRSEMVGVHPLELDDE